MRMQNVALKIHFPVPKRLCKQGTKNVFNRQPFISFSDSVLSGITWYRLVVLGIVEYSEKFVAGVCE